VLRDEKVLAMARKILRPAKKQPLLIRNEALLQQKREAVMEAAFALFLQQGFHSTTTRDIARRAGVSAGAPFTYFKDKEEILFYIVSKEQDLATEQLIATLSRQIAEATHNATDPEEVFKTVFTTWLHAVDVMRRYILLAYQETKSLNSETQRALMAREKRLQTLIGEAIRYGAERGRFSPDNIALKAHNIMVLGHAWAIRHWAFAGEMESIEEYIDFLQPLMLAMLETKAGSEMTHKRRRPPTTIGRRIPQRQGEVTAK
jgi:TetR/AcrR family transcriptional regulator, cholesterol catabolism regulator